MTLATVASFQPVARNEYLERLGALPSEPVLAPELWAEVHDEIQAQLGPLETEIRRRVPGIRVSTGRTSGEQFFLFSYRTFSKPGVDLDPVVVGMTFTSVDQGVNVEADASGEQTGGCISSVASKTVPPSREELLAAARESAGNLCQSAEAIATALTDPSRGID